jgi:hypothetical protein
LDVRATLSAVTLLIVPSFGKLVLNTGPAVAPAPLLQEVNNPSVEAFWASTVSVSVEDTPGTSSNVAKEAVLAWNEQLGQAAFDLNDSHPLIEITFSRNLSESGNAVAGLTTWRRDANGELHAHVQLRTSTPDGRPMPKEALRQAALHELGHSLGLEDNVQAGKGAGVMGRLNVCHPILLPSKEEVLAVRQVRALSAFQAVIAEKS